MIQLRKWLTQHFTLRVRLAFWSSVLVFGISLGLTLFINGIAELTAAQTSKNISVQQTRSPSENPSGAFIEAPSAQRPAVAGPISTQVVPPSNLQEILRIQQIILTQVRNISILGMALVALLSGFAAYGLTGMALKPVKRVSDFANRIGEDTMDTRLSLVGPPDELKNLADAFDKMLDRLEYAFQQQNNFVADAAHELRTPLSIIQTSLDAIRVDPTATLRDYQEMTGTVERTLRRLEKLVNDLLLLARGEQELKKEEIALGNLITEVASEIGPFAQEKNIRLEVKGKEEVLVRGDETLLGIAIYNLIENAIYYNRPAGKVEVSLSKADQQARVTIKDTGIGISPDDLPYVFDRFFRIDRSRTRNKGGAGLGLAIVAHIVQLHGGRITVESLPDAGSTFMIDLPQLVIPM